MKQSYKLYRFCYRIARLLLGIVFCIDIRGREHIPNGPAMVCANHSNKIDPFFIAFAFGIENHMHIIAKVELFKIPILAGLLRKLGMISVNRGISDVGTIKETLSYLKNGEKVAIFPEGTRVPVDDAVMAKNGAVKLAERAGVPLVPVFMPRQKRVFKRIPVVIGEPYFIKKQSGKLSSEEYSELAGDLMERIKGLNPELTASSAEGG